MRLCALHICRLPPTSTPKTTYFIDILPDAFTIAVVSYSISISLSKVFALKHGYVIHSNQVLVLTVRSICLTNSVYKNIFKFSLCVNKCVLF